MIWYRGTDWENKLNTMEEGSGNIYKHIVIL